MELKLSTALQACAAQLLFAGSAYASQWTVTSYYAVVETTSTYSTYTEDWAVDTYTQTITLKPSAVEDFSVSATSTYVSEDTYYDVKIVEVYYDPTDVDSSDIVPTSTYNSDDYTYTYYYQEVFYTAPASCETAFTVQTYVDVYIPSEVRDQITPSSVTTYTSSYDDGGKYTMVQAFLSEGEVSLSSATTKDFIQSYYLDDCINPTATGSDRYNGDYGYGDDNDDDDDSSSSGGGYGYTVCSLYGYGCTSLQTWIIIIASVLPGLFVLGFIESFFWFRRMMLGKAALRFGTICWVLLTLLVLCFTRHSPARNKADAPALREQWNAMSIGTRIKLWFRWGFRHAYPIELLGPDPKTFKDPRPADGTQPPPMMYMGPPGPNGQPPPMMFMGPPGPNGQPQMMMMGPPGPDGQPQMMMVPVQMPPPVEGQPPMQYYPYPQYPMGTQPPTDPNNPANTQSQMYTQPQMYMQPMYMQPAVVPKDAPSSVETPSPMDTPAPITTPSPVHTHTPVNSQPPVLPPLNNEAPAVATSAVEAPADAPPAVPPPPANKDA
ncbi:hypothetical protein BGZ61DRAFT_452058 [Ilyonectria robusta]|uniref:uncharacterized protein n=1 Tax=Ilyonectria robusta TaxID=1079257 RepID=UPI001E8E86E3|nr:uncharacterized protein BGZ61DRAFT_452058 [Ilyonectria robusta]KAH8694533.1 hypothetical protein BGZ61DRAFT_452058 [Ilyonectria robusta]